MSEVNLELQTVKNDIGVGAETTKKGERSGNIINFNQENLRKYVTSWKVVDKRQIKMSSRNTTAIQLECME